MIIYGDYSSVPSTAKCPSRQIMREANVTKKIIMRFPYGAMLIWKRNPPYIFERFLFPEGYKVSWSDYEYSVRRGSLVPDNDA